MNKAIQLRNIMWTSAFTDYIMTAEWVAHVLTLVAWIKDPTLWSTISDMVPASTMVAVNNSIINTPVVSNIFPKVILQEDEIKLRAWKSKKFKLKWSYFTPNTEIIVEWCVLDKFTFKSDNKIYIKLTWWIIKWKFNITFKSTWWEIIFNNFINIR